MKQNIVLIPRNFVELVKPTGNIYETVVIIAKRAKQIASKTKEELNEKLSEFVPHSDNLEELCENKEHMEISKHYERQPKPTIIATEELLADEIVYRYPDEEASLKI